jgi:pimeloyl-ACP methyl ester carboxylesterase
MTPLTTSETQFVDIPWNGHKVALEFQWVGCPREATEYPVVVFLHEGLGSMSMWRDFPQRFCTAHGFAGLVFSRYGYGRSTPRPQQERLAPTYLHRQALEALPAFLAALDVKQPWLFGHSDGGSIALLYAAHFPRQVSGIAVMAPHIFVEDITIAGIRAAREAYVASDMEQRLARHHQDPRSVFFGWNDAWLDPAFRSWNIEAVLPRISCPILAIQGEGDEYGTLAQIEGIRRCNPRTALLVLKDCGHSPQRDQPQLLIDTAGRFMAQPLHFDAGSANA